MRQSRSFVRTLCLSVCFFVFSYHIYMNILCILRISPSSLLLCLAATSFGLPSSARMFGSAPCIRRNFTNSRAPARVAKYNGVSPRLIIRIIRSFKEMFRKALLCFYVNVSLIKEQSLGIPFPLPKTGLMKRRVPVHILNVHVGFLFNQLF